ALSTAAASLVRADSRLDGKVAVLTLASARTRNGERAMCIQPRAARLPVPAARRGAGTPTGCSSPVPLPAALSEAMVRDLHAAVEAASNDERVRAIVLTHDGPVFSAGHDLRQVRRWQAEGNTDALGASFAATAAVARMLRLTAPPTIAVVNGLATAAGCQLALSCDMVVASNGSAFATPGSSVGLFCTSPAVAVMAAAPSKLAAEMLLCGKPIPAARALAFGMINYVSGGDATGACDDEAHRGAMDKAMELAEAVASHPRDVIAFGKRATARVGCAPTLDQADQLAGAAMVENCAMPDASEGISAFTEKRTPSWRK
ncbi:Echdc3, partial [Symbiodinium microadriaticum]